MLQRWSSAQQLMAIESKDFDFVMQMRSINDAAWEVVRNQKKR
ncbi:MAG: hypothetical protein RLZZ507_1803 [Cyanobacteriota bacterium]|jgi:hypothetical protein